MSTITYYNVRYLLKILSDQNIFHILLFVVCSKIKHTVNGKKSMKSIFIGFSLWCFLHLFAFKLWFCVCFCYSHSEKKSFNLRNKIYLPFCSTIQFRSSGRWRGWRWWNKWGKWSYLRSRLFLLFKTLFYFYAYKQNVRAYFILH